MFAKIFLLLIIVPLVELGLLLILTEVTHSLVTWLLVIFSGLIGAMLARQQGIATFRRIQKELSQGHMPTDSMLDGVMILFAGALLLTPGLLTDCLGLSILIPPVRYWYKRRVTNWAKQRFKIEHFAARAVQDAASGVVDSHVVDSHVVEPADQVASEQDESPEEKPA